MHPVDRDELLGQRERDAVVVGLGARDAGEDLVLDDLLEQVAELLAGQAVPVGVQAGRCRRVGGDGRRPLDGVDLGEQRGGDQPGASGRARSSSQPG